VARCEHPCFYHSRLRRNGIFTLLSLTQASPEGTVNLYKEEELVRKPLCGREAECGTKSVPSTSAILQRNVTILARLGERHVRKDFRTRDFLKCSKKKITSPTRMQNVARKSIKGHGRSKTLSKTVTVSLRTGDHTHVDGCCLTKIFILSKVIGKRQHKPSIAQESCQISVVIVWCGLKCHRERSAMLREKIGSPQGVDTSRPNKERVKQIAPVCTEASTQLNI